MKKVAPTAAKPHRGPKARPILYVEDDDVNWRVAELRLGTQFEMTRAKTDKQACDILRSSGSRFVVILMDIELQGSILNGIDLTRLIRGRPIAGPVPSFAEALPALDTPVIFITAYGDIHAESTLREAGGDKLMTKPVDFKALNMALMNLYVNRQPG